MKDIITMAKAMIDIMSKAGKFPKLQSDTHLRNWSEKKKERKAVDGISDPTREHLNFEVIESGEISEVNKKKSITKRIEENFKRRGIVDPNDRPYKRPDQHKPWQQKRKYVTHVHLILGGDQEVMRCLAYGEQKIDWDLHADNSTITRRVEIEEWAVDIYNFVAKKMGRGQHRPIHRSSRPGQSSCALHSPMCNKK